jgi:hypothetical protein
VQGHDEAASAFHHHRIGMGLQGVEAGLQVAQVDHHLVIARGNVRRHGIGQGIGVVESRRHLQAGGGSQGHHVVVEPVARLPAWPLNPVTARGHGLHAHHTGMACAAQRVDQGAAGAGLAHTGVGAGHEIGGHAGVSCSVLGQR